MTIIYTAGPITGLDLDEVFEHFSNLNSHLIAMGYQVYHPMIGKEHLKGGGVAQAKGYDHPLSSDRAITGRDRFMVSQADILWADLSRASEKASIGTTAEIAWAYDQRPHTLVVLSGLHEGHAMDHAFIRQMADHIFDTREEVIRFLRTMSPLKTRRR